jgi:hypothetical protein
MVTRNVKLRGIVCSFLDGVHNDVFPVAVFIFFVSFLRLKILMAFNSGTHYGRTFQ